MHEWLIDARGRIAQSVEESPAAYDLSEEDAEVLLALAGVAAHESEDRTNAPLVSYLVGLAVGRHGCSLEAAASAARGAAPQDGEHTA
jgi:hypothetical protein